MDLYKQTIRLYYLSIASDIEGSVDNGIHAGICTCKHEESFLYSLVDFPCTVPIDPVPFLFCFFFFKFINKINVLIKAVAIY